MRAQYASEVEEVEVGSLWGGRLPEKCLTVLVGESGTGKSTLARHLVRCLTRGENLPDGQEVVAKVGVIWISNEEDTGSVLVPQLRLMGADLSKIRILSRIQPDSTQLGQASTRRWQADNKEDLDLLRQTIWDDPQDNIGLVVIDAARGMSTKSISYPKLCREVLEGLQKVAEDTSVAILLLHHTNRRKSNKSIEKVAGSGEMYNYPRCVWMLSKSEDDESKINLTVPKPFLTETPPALSYKKVGMETGGEKWVKIEWQTKGVLEAKRAEYEQADADKLDEIILTFLAAHPGQSWQPRQLTAVCKRDYDAVAKQLQRLAAAGRIDKPKYGLYCIKASDISSGVNSVQVQVAKPAPKAGKLAHVQVGSPSPSRVDRPTGGNGSH